MVSAVGWTVARFLFASAAEILPARPLQLFSFQERTEEKKKIYEMAGGNKKKKDFKFRSGGKTKKEAPQPPLTEKERAAKEKAEKKAVFTSGHVSSDEDTSFQRVVSPANKNPSMRGGTFVPSLGSVSEVEHSDLEEQEDETEQTPPRRLTLGQRFLICIGRRSPKELVYAVTEEVIPFSYEDRIEPAVTVEEGRKNSAIEEEEEEQEAYNKIGDQEKKFLLPPSKRNTVSRERSTGSRRSAERASK